MTFFKNFPKITYAGQQGVNILTSVIPSRMNIDKAFIYQNHLIADGETPESIADRLYGDANLYWVILVVNRVISPFTDWPIADNVFDEYVDKKYGDSEGVHHYWDNRIDRMCDDVDDAAYRLVPPSSLPFYIVPVTNGVYERELNDGRRSILLINPRYVDQFVEAYNDAVKGVQE